MESLRSIRHDRSDDRASVPSEQCLSACGCHRRSGEIYGIVEKEAERVFENNKDIHLDLHSKIHDGKIKVDQAAIAGCAAGSFENIYAVDQIAKKMNHGLGTFPFNIYPASQPIMYELNKIGVLNDLMNYGVRVKTAFCGPCFGASDAPGNNDFCIRHSTETSRTVKAPTRQTARSLP